MKLRFIRGWLVVGLFLFWLFSLVLLVVSYQLNDVTEYLLILMGICFILIILVDTYFSFSLYEGLQKGSLKTKNIIVQTLVNQNQSLQRDLINQSKQHDDEKQRLLEHYTLWTHQIKTPITALSLFQEDLPTYELRMKHRLELNRIETNVTQMISYVRLQSIQHDLILKTVDIGIITQEVLKKYAVFFMFQSKQLSLEKFSFMYVSDSKWFGLLVDQLISNAVKYATKTVRLYFNYPYLCVEDDGPGMDLTALKDANQLGFTGDLGRIHGASTGIGLYLADQIANQLGVKLHFESNQPRGLKVKIEFKEKITLNDKFVS